ncbi:MAG: hypothetical protein WCY82_01025 [Desulfotomaculaceae bacterium]
MINNAANELFSFLIFGLPEGIVIALLTITLLRIKYKWSIVLFIGALTATVVLVFRLQLFITGIHTAAAIIVMALLVAHFFKIPKLTSMIASVVGLLILNIFELFGFVVIKYVFAMDINDLAQNMFYWVIFAWVKIILVCLTVLVISRTDWYLRGRNNSDNKSLSS